MKNTKWIIGGSFAFVFVAASFWWLGQNQTKNQAWDKRVQTKQNQSHDRILAAGDDDLIQNINNRIIAIRHKKEIKPLIKEINELADDKKNKENYTLQLYRAVLSPVAQLEGIIWRMRGFVEKSGTMHLAALSYIRKFYYKDYLFGPHIIAFADYLIEPSTKDLKFMKIHELQDYLEAVIVPELETSLARVKDIIKQAPDDWSMAYDSYLTTGYDPENGKVFLSSGKRWKRHIIKPNLFFLTSFIQRTLGGIKYSINYNVDDLPRFVNTVVKRSAINSIRKKLKLKGLPEPVTPLEIMAILNSSGLTNLDNIKGMKFMKGNFVNFLTLRGEKKAVAAKNLKESMEYFYTARLDERTAYTQSINQSNAGAADSYVLNPEIMDLERSEVMAKLDTMISLYESALNQKSKRIVSEVTGSSIEINLNALFTPYQDLKIFLPTVKDGFNQKLSKGGTMMDENNSTVKHSKTNQTIFAWNYKYGMPLKWPNPTFGGLLPEANNENMYSIARTISITSGISGLKDFLPIP